MADETPNIETPLAVASALPSDFQTAGGSVVRKSYHKDPKNNQDAYDIISNADYHIGVVCDGCGKSPHSEVGAKVGCKVIAHSIAKNLVSTGGDMSSESFMEMIRGLTIDKIRTIAEMMGPTMIADDNGNPVRLSQTETYTQYLLFTTVGFIIHKNKTTVFLLGDGITVVNGNISKFDSGPSNKPMYISYGVTGSSLADQSLKNLQFRTWTYPTQDVQNLMVGCDGVGDLIDKADTKLPGKEEKAGPISQFWENNFFFENPDGIRRRLWTMNKFSRRSMDQFGQRVYVEEHGLLNDDTTLIVARRKPNGK